MLSLLIFAVQLVAQQGLPLSSCEPTAALRRILDQQLSVRELASLKFVDRVAFTRQTLESLIGEYPREVEPYRQLIQFTKEETPVEYPDLIARFEKQAADHPDDPLALYLAGLALSGTNTVRSIEFLDRARSRAPAFAWPALELAHIYGPGKKRANHAKAATEISAFFAICPSSADAFAQAQLTDSGDKALQSGVATALRKRLTQETDPIRLKDYAVLWSLEFRTHSPAEYPTLRAQTLADLRRLGALNPKPDLDWLVFLKEGFKLSGAPTETVVAAEDRILQKYPRSEEAFEITKDRWEKAHKEPKNPADTAAWAVYHHAYRTALKTWRGQFTDSLEVQHAETFYAALYDPDMPEQEGRRAVDDYLHYISEYRVPSINDLLTATWVLTNHNWEPARVFTLLQDSDKLLHDWSSRMLTDNLSEETESLFKNNLIILQQALASRILVAARLAEQPAQAQHLRPFIERTLPPNTWPRIEAQYWLDRGRLALLDGHTGEAFKDYQKALQLHRDPEPIEGSSIDDMMDEARALWQRMGVAEPPAYAPPKDAGGGWQTPPKPLPEFELSDLSGKTWRAKDLVGRVVLINVWATWCGPCQRELPHIQSLYTRLKDRLDVQILTFSIDDDPGALSAFLKAKGYTFPVLPAQSFVTQVLDTLAVPQTWILDAEGKWRWTGGPTANDAEWESALLRQVESVRQK